MERSELNFVLEDNRYLKGGTKEACVKIRDFTSRAKILENQNEYNRSYVTADEFLDSVKTILAFAFRQPDTTLTERMTLRDLNFIFENTHYLKGGTKQACVKVHKFVSRARVSGLQIRSNNSCVTDDEFLDSVETILFFTFNQPDTIPERWYCENDCCRVSWLLCPGECNIDENAPKLCPFYMDEGFI